MQNQLPEQVTNLNRHTLTTMQKFAELNSSVWMNLSQKHIDVFTLYLDGSFKQVQIFTQNQSTDAMFKAHHEFSQTFQQDLLKIMQDTTAVLYDAEQQWLALCEINIQEMGKIIPNLSNLSKVDSADVTPVTVTTKAVETVAETVEAVAEQVVETITQATAASDDKPAKTAQPAAKKTTKRTTRKTTKSAKATKAEATDPTDTSSASAPVAEPMTVEAK